MTSSALSNPFTLSASFVQNMDTNLRNQLINETLLHYEFGAFEALLPFTNHAYSTHSYTSHYLEYLIALAPLNTLERLLPTFLQTNTNMIASQSFKGFSIGHSFAALLCNTIDAKNDDPKLRHPNAPTYEQHLEVIRFILQTDRQNQLFSWISTDSSHSTLFNKLVKNPSKYFPDFDSNSYGTPNILQLLYSLNEPTLYPLLKNHPRFEQILTSSSISSSPIPFLANEQYWIHNPQLSKLLLEQYIDFCIKSLNLAPQGTERYAYKFSKNLYETLAFHSNPHLRNEALPILARLPIKHFIQACDYTAKYRLISQVHKTLQQDLPFADRICTQIHEALFIHNNQIQKQDHQHLLLQTLSHKNSLISNNLLDVFRSIYPASGTPKDRSDLNMPESFYDHLISFFPTSSIVSHLFDFPQFMWEPLCARLDHGEKLLGFSGDRAGLDPSILMIASQHHNPNAFPWMIDYFDSKGLLDKALQERAWVFSQGTGRKKGDVLAFCIAHGQHEQVQYLLSKRPDIQSSSAKKVVKKMSESSLGNHGLRAQSAFDQLTLQQQFDISIGQPTLGQPVPTSTGRKRL